MPSSEHVTESSSPVIGAEKKKKKKSKHSKEDNEVQAEENEESSQLESPKKKKRKRKSETSDVESSPKKTKDDNIDLDNSKSSSDLQVTAPKVGQWASAQFESADQQNNFLRLMGAFKKPGNDNDAPKKKSLFG